MKLAKGINLIWIKCLLINLLQEKYFKMPWIPVLISNVISAVCYQFKHIICYIWYDPYDIPISYVTYHIIWSIRANISLESSESADLLAVRYGNYYPDNIDSRAEDDVTELNGLVYLFTKQLLIPNSAFIFRSQSYDFNFILKNYVCFCSNKAIGPVRHSLWSILDYLLSIV